MEPLDAVLDTWRSFAIRFSAVCFGCSPSSCCCKSIHARRGECLIQSMTFIYLSGNGHHPLQQCLECLQYYFYFSCSAGIYFVFVPVISIYVYLTVE